MHHDGSRPLLWAVLLSALCVWLLLSGSRLHAEATASAPSSPISAEPSMPTPPLGSGDYAEYQTSLAVLRAKIEFYRSSLRRAVSENSTIRDELEKQKAALEQHSSDSTISYEQQQQTIQRLTGRLSASDVLVSELRASLESKAAEYLTKLQTAEGQAARLERQVRGWRIAAIVAGLAAVGAGIWAAVK